MTPREVLSLVAIYTGIDPEEIRSQYQHQELVEARDVAIKLLRQEGYPTRTIARTINRDCSVVRKRTRMLQLR